MCACEDTYVCSRCEGTRDEPGYADKPDEDMPLEAPVSDSDALGWYGP